MKILKDTITWGQSYDLNVAAQDTGGNPVTMTGAWSAYYRVTKDKIGGAIVAEGAMTIAAGTASATIDTAATGWAPGDYFYDCRVTDPDGYDDWTQPVKLTLEPRNSPPSS